MLGRVKAELSESYEDLKEGVGDTYDAIIHGNDEPVDFDRRKAIVSAGSLIAGWEGLKRTPDGARWAAGQNPYEVDIRRRDREGELAKDSTETPKDDPTEEPVFDGGTVSEMLESEGQVTRNAFSDYLCVVDNESDIETYSLENAYNDRDVVFEIRGDQVSIRGSQPGFSASKEFEDYIVEHHKEGTLENQLLDYWRAECQ